MNEIAQNPRNVVLTGFMGTGKTTVGRLLATRLGFAFVDTDEVIEQRFGAIPEIFASAGEERFREIERFVAGELSGSAGLVIATGGRMMLDPANAAALGDRARVFCLVAPVEELIRRLEQGDGPERPLLAGADPAGRIADLLAERASGYGQFEHVDTEGRTPAEIVTELLLRLGIAV